MEWQYTPYVLPLIIAAIISVAVALLAWRRRPAPGAATLAWLMLAVAEWSLAYAVELGSTGLPAKLFWSNLSFIGTVTGPTLWLVFVLQHTRRDKWLTRRNLALLAIVPLVTLFLVWTNNLHHLFSSAVRLDTSGPLPLLNFTWGIGFWVNTAYSYLLFLLCTLLLIQAILRLPHLYRGQTGTMLTGALVPWVANALYLSGLSLLPLMPFAFTICGIVITWGCFRYRLLDIVPVARDTIIERMSDAVVVLDAQNRIVDLNPSAARLLGRAVSEAIGQPAEQVFAGWSGLAARYRDMPVAEAEIALGEGKARRHFDLRISPLYDRRGRFTGRLVVLHDITERKRVEEEQQHRLRDLALLHEISKNVSASLDLGEVLNRVVQGAVEAVEADAASLNLLLEVGQARMMASVGLSEQFKARTDVRPAGTTMTVISTRQPLLIPDVTQQPDLMKPFVLEEGIKSFIVLPLPGRERVIGAMFVFWRRKHAFSDDEVRLLVTFANQAAVAVENARLHAEVQQLAITDALTSLYNRRGLFELGRHEVERARRFERPLAGVMFDLDHFKLVNDACGHATGDQVLAGLAARCRHELRAVDLLGRYGGEEFVVLLPETDLAGAMQVAEQLRHCVEQGAITTEPTNATPHGPITITISLGVAMLDKDCTTLEALIERADRALYAAKQAGRNCVRAG